MSEDRYFIAKDNYSVTDKEGRSVDVIIGNQFLLLEDLSNDNMKLRFIDSSLSELNEIVLPRSILDDIPKPISRKLPNVLRSQSTIKERITSLNFNDKVFETPEKHRFSTFGHGSLPDGMSRSTYESNRNRTLPAVVTLITTKEKSQQPEPVLEEKKKDPLNSGDNITVMRKSAVSDQKWNLVSENGHEVHVNVNTGERWHSTIDKTGRQYFYNESSRKSMWELPNENPVMDHIFSDEAVRPIEEVPENPNELSDSSVSWDSKEDINDKEVQSPTFDASDAANNTQEEDTRFNVRHIKKEHISGPFCNKLMRTERAGAIEKTKINENGREVPKKWATFHVILTGPELLFYKDLKAVAARLGRPRGKVELKLKIQNLQFSETSDVGNKGSVLQIEDTGAPGSNITYLLRFATLEDMRSWQMALQYAKDWQNENMYLDNSFNTDGGLADDMTSDMQNIGVKLKQFLKRRPTRESLELRGILKLESVFGSSLDILCEHEKNKVPEFVIRCILAIEARGLHHNGIYRVSGNQAKIQKLRLAVDENKYQLSSESMELETLTGSLKSFFKELKEPLFDDEFCSKMVEILMHRKVDKKNPYRDVNISSAKKLVLKLKPSHHATAKALIEHLHKVAALSSKNLMDISNLSMVWGPNLYLVSGQASTKLAVILMTHNQIIDFLITNYSELFVDKH